MEPCVADDRLRVGIDRSYSAFAGWNDRILFHLPQTRVLRGMITLQDAITVIVRESGERTADACVSLLEEAFNGAVIHRVRGPFHVTLRRALELGIAQGKPDTLYRRRCVGAAGSPPISGGSGGVVAERV